MVELARSRIFLTALTVWASFFPVLLLLGDRNTFIMIGSLTFTVSTAIVWAYWPAAKTALKHGTNNLDFIDLLALGVICTWFAASGRFATITFYRWWTEAPPSDLEIWPVAFFQFVNVTGGILHLSAKQVMRNSVPRSSWPLIMFALVLGAVMGLVLILTRGV